MKNKTIASVLALGAFALVALIAPVSAVQDNASKAGCTCECTTKCKSCAKCAHCKKCCKKKQCKKCK